MYFIKTVKYTLIFLAVSLVVGSCNLTDNIDKSGIIVPVKLTATTDEDWIDATKASQDGGLVNLIDKGYELRHILEVYSSDGKTLEYRSEPIYQDITTEKPVVSFDLQLIAKTYKFVFWTDIVKREDRQITAAYNTDKLANITANYDAEIDQEAYDAFTAIVSMNLSEGSNSISAKLKRPHAKIRIIETGKKAIDTENSKIGSFKTVISGQIPTKYNAINGTSLEPEYISMKECLSYIDSEQVCLFTGYIFADSKENTTQCNLSIKVTKTDNENSKNWESEAKNITLRQNSLITLKGSIVK